MKLLWRRKSDRPDSPDDADVTDLTPKRATPYADRMRRIRNGQDIEFEQLTVYLRNKHF